MDTNGLERDLVDFCWNVFSFFSIRPSHSAWESISTFRKKKPRIRWVYKRISAICRFDLLFLRSDYWSPTGPRTGPPLTASVADRPVGKTAKKTRSVHCGSELAADGGPKDTRSLLEPPLIWIHRTRQRHGRRTGPHKYSSRLERFSNSSVLFSSYVVSLYFFRYEGLIFESRNA